MRFGLPGQFCGNFAKVETSIISQGVSPGIVPECVGRIYFEFVCNSVHRLGPPGPYIRQEDHQLHQVPHYIRWAPLHQAPPPPHIRPGGLPYIRPGGLSYIRPEGSPTSGRGPLHQGEVPPLHQGVPPLSASQLGGGGHT